MMEALCEIRHTIYAIRDTILLQRIVESFDWLVADARHRADDCRMNFELGSAGGYHPKLTSAIELLAELKRDEDETTGGDACGV